ncbi:MAG: hypothetical protein VX589_20265, partial [Myxococcota bacterium]|nr:hypothetical protein [Myxococcota bacterium]
MSNQTRRHVGPLCVAFWLSLTIGCGGNDGGSMSAVQPSAGEQAGGNAVSGAGGTADVNMPSGDAASPPAGQNVPGQTGTTGATDAQNGTGDAMAGRPAQPPMAGALVDIGPQGGQAPQGGVPNDSSPPAVDDRDQDGAKDDEDNCPDIVNGDQADTDEDGVGDACDNCPLIENSDQTDANGD